MSQALIIAADDFAYSAEIDAGILNLVRQNRLSAYSCMTFSPRWSEAASAITSDIKNRADIGLHLDFTQFNPDLNFSLPSVIVRSHVHSLTSKPLIANIHRQLDLFEQALNQAPDYIDGHQHVHQLPQIREALITALQARYPQHCPAIRIAQPPTASGFKAKIIGALGASALARLSHKHQIKSTAILLGIYEFNLDQQQYMQQFANWLSLAQTQPAVCSLMCHPAQALTQSSAIADGILQARYHEYAGLISEQFLQLLDKYQIQLTRYSLL
jgi:chitin disaccharide deacetylase